MLYKHSELILQLRTVRHLISDSPTPLQQSPRFLARKDKGDDDMQEVYRYCFILEDEQNGSRFLAQEEDFVELNY